MIPMREEGSGPWYAKNAAEPPTSTKEKPPSIDFSYQCLPLSDLVEFGPPIFCVGTFIPTVCGRPFFTVRDDAYPFGSNAAPLESVANAEGPLFPQREIVIETSPFIGMSCNDQRDGLIGYEELGKSIQVCTIMQ